MVSGTVCPHQQVSGLYRPGVTLSRGGCPGLDFFLPNIDESATPLLPGCLLGTSLLLYCQVPGHHTACNGQNRKLLFFFGFAKSHLFNSFFGSSSSSWLKVLVFAEAIGEKSRNPCVHLYYSVLGCYFYRMPGTWRTRHPGTPGIARLSRIIEWSERDSIAG